MSDPSVVSPDGDATVVSGVARVATTRSVREATAALNRFDIAATRGSGAMPFSSLRTSRDELETTWPVARSTPSSTTPSALA